MFVCLYTNSGGVCICIWMGTDNLLTCLPPACHNPFSSPTQPACTDSIRATLRMSDNQAEHAAQMEAARAAGMRSELAGVYSSEFVCVGSMYILCI